MIHNRIAAIVIVAAIVLGVVGVGVYQYVKYTPPAWLVKFVTAKKPPPELPAGDIAPIIVPDGFVATIFSRDVPGARVMIRDQKGTILASLTEGGKVVALPDKNHDGKAEETITVLDGLRQPHGLAIMCPDPTTEICTLYVAETGELTSYSYNADTFTASGTATLATFPTGDGHFTRTLLVAPDQKHLLISIGSSCNVCNEDDALRASVQSFDLATNKMTPYATGLRNSVFMAIDPVGGGIWATENGRDILGDDIPPDELNILSSPSTGPGQNPARDFGWPICYGQNIHDTDFDKNQYTRNPCVDKVPAHVDLQAHSAALGLMFIPQDGWPTEYRDDLLVAYHGSWNRTFPTGYKVVRFDLDPQTRKPIGDPIDFATGYLPEGSRDTNDAIGRPVAMLPERGGVVYISDDRAGAIYRVSMIEPLE
jgi:glucose/arabinose dehydrogenase